MLARWEAEGTFAKLREQNAGGPTFSFIDGPITANGPAGVHTAWGRTLKDVFQRYKALARPRAPLPERLRLAGPPRRGRGREGARPQLEARDRGVRPRPVRARVPRLRREVRRRCRPRSRSGSASGWTGATTTSRSATRTSSTSGASSRRSHERDWLYKGHRSTQWCPRCGTSLSKHEQVGEENYDELEHPSLFVRFPLRGPRGRVARRSGRRRRGRCPRTSRPPSSPTRSTGATTSASGSPSRAIPEEHFEERVRGCGARRLEYARPVRRLRRAGGRRPPRHPVGRGLARRGHRHRPHRAGLRRRGLRALARPRSAGARADRRVGPDAAPATASSRACRRTRSSSRSSSRCASAVSSSRRPRSSTAIPSAGAAARRSSSASSTTGSSPPTRSGSRCSTRTRRSSGRRRSTGQADGRLAPQHGRLEHLAPPLLRPAAAVLPVRVRAPERDRLARRARGARRLGARAARGAAPAVDRRASASAARAAAREVERIKEVGDAWLDAGIVHFSTLGWQNPEWIPGGYATGASRGALRRRPARQRVLGEVVPGRLGLGDARADPALVLLAVLHGGHARRAGSRTGACSRYEKMLDETGREMHKSWGNAIELDDALERMGADVMRWLFCCAARPSAGAALRLRARGGGQAALPHLLELRQVLRRLREHRRVPAGVGERSSRTRLEPLDRWLVERTHAFVADATARLRALATRST